jgi:hypothetical protein
MYTSALCYVVQVHLPTSSLSSVRELFPLLDLPAEMQGLVLGYLPLADLARLACLNKELRAAYGERVTKRDTAVAALLQSQFTAKFRQGLSPAQTALPRDLVAHPQVGRWSFIRVFLCGNFSTIVHHHCTTSIYKIWCHMSYVIGFVFQ